MAKDVDGVLPHNGPHKDTFPLTDSIVGKGHIAKVPHGENANVGPDKSHAEGS